MNSNKCTILIYLIADRALGVFKVIKISVFVTYENLRDEKFLMRIINVISGISNKYFANTHYKIQRL